MSVLLLCQESFWKVYSSLPFLGHRFFYDMDYTKAKAFVKELYILNQKSYFEAYKHHKSVSENFQLKERLFNSLLFLIKCCFDGK